MEQYISSTGFYEASGEIKIDGLDELEADSMLELSATEERHGAASSSVAAGSSAGFTTYSIPNSHFFSTPVGSATVLAVYYTDASGVDRLAYYGTNSDIGQGGDDTQAKAVYNKLIQNRRNPNPGAGWTKITPRGPSRIGFGSKATRVYFVMLWPDWRFATKVCDAFMTKLPISNYYSSYRVIRDPAYLEKMFSIFNHNPFDGASHDYSLACIDPVSLKVTLLDPKFENP